MRALWLGIAFACGVGMATAAQAADQKPPPAPVAKPAGQTTAGGKKQSDPGVLSADKVTYDETLGIVTATGNVELIQGSRTVYADAMNYNQKTKVVIASGNVRMFEPSGEVMFSDYAELTDDLATAFVDNVKVLSTDKSRMVGNEAERRGGRMTRISRGVYSPCDLCAKDPSRPPLWQMRAVKIVHDNEEHQVRYQDAVMEMFGLPVFYTPYFSHPDPNVPRQSGFLGPVFGNNGDTGAFVRNAYYFDIAPDRDATAYLSLYSKQVPVLGAEYRQRFERGRLQVEGSFTQSDLTRDLGSNTVVKPNAIRGNLFGQTRFDLSDAWRAGGNLAYSSDKLYLRQYFGFREDILTSRAFAEGFYGRDYAGINAYRFQDLRSGSTLKEPVAFPLAQYQAFGEPGETLGGRWMFDAGLLGLGRDGGTDYTRASLLPGWQREFRSETGLVATIGATLRTDIYHFQHYIRPDQPGVMNETASAKTRVMPEANATLRYPLVRQGESTYQLIEPIASLTVAPRAINDLKIPNEDSQDLEFSDTNLFRTNRISGYDRLEGGQRVAYGVRVGLFGVNEGRVSALIGQSYRFSTDKPFPDGSGLETRRSDYVGRIDVSPASWLNAYYGFRYQKAELDPRLQTVGLQVGVPMLNFSSNYNFSDASTDANATQHVVDEFATFAVNSQVTRHWSTTLSHQQRFNPNPGPSSSALALNYVDECLVMQAIGQRDYSTVPGLSNGLTVYFRFIFRNLGEITTPTLAASNFTGSQSGSGGGLFGR